MKKIKRLLRLNKVKNKITSGTVVMLITEAFHERQIRLSAFEENRGPSIVITVPDEWKLRPKEFAVSERIYI